MFHMHSVFDLKPQVSPACFEAAWDALIAHLMAADLVVSGSALSERRSSSPLDTDEDRGHSFFIVMTFRDKAQSDAAYAAIEAHVEPTAHLHVTVLGMVTEAIFTCWEDRVPEGLPAVQGR
ncbi:MAG: DUF6614 family protein [Pseudomonadota bacterium]